MEQGHLSFPDNIIRFEPRVARVSEASVRRLPRTAVAGRLSADGLADRLREDVERQVAHRRRMLEHLSSAR